jgi:hypothetical protein
LREDGLDCSDEEVHGVDVDEGMVLDVAVLNLDGHDLAGLLQASFVDLSEAGNSQRFFFKVSEDFRRL